MSEPIIKKYRVVPVTDDMVAAFKAVTGDPKNWELPGRAVLELALQAAILAGARVVEVPVIFESAPWPEIAQLSVETKPEGRQS